MKWVNDEKIAFLKIENSKEWKLKVLDKNKGNLFQLLQKMIEMVGSIMMDKYISLMMVESFGFQKKLVIST